MELKMKSPLKTIATAAFATLVGNESTMNTEFQTLGAQYIEQFAAFSPVGATGLGDHRLDGQLDDVSAASREQRIHWIREFIDRLEQLPLNCRSISLAIWNTLRCVVTRNNTEAMTLT